jgi:hypothetical protein
VTGPLFQYVMVGQNTSPPYQSIYWLVYNTPDTTGQFSGYFGSIQNISVVSTQQVTYPSNATPQVSANALNGVPLANTSPAEGQALVYDSTSNAWVPGNAAGGQFNVTLHNGLNSNLVTSGLTVVRLGGNTAAASIDGLSTLPPAGTTIVFINTTSYPITIVGTGSVSAFPFDTQSRGSSIVLQPKTGSFSVTGDQTASTCIVQNVGINRPLPYLVDDYGADPTGTVDSTSAITAALTAASSSASACGTVLLGLGTYLTSSTLTIPVGVTLQGQGWTASTISKNTPGDVLLSTHAINFGAAAHITVRDIGVINTSTTGLSAWQASHPYSTGALLKVNGRIVLKCTTGGTSGAFRPLGQMTWLTPNGSPAYVGPNVTLTGTPGSTLSFLIKMIAGGARGTATFQYSTNNGSTWSGTLTTGASVSLTGGISAAFAVGTYVINTYAASPTFGWSLANGTSIVDGSVTWEVLDGGAGFCDIGGAYVTIENFRAYGCTCGITFDQTESSSVYNIDCESIGWAAIWLANGATHTVGADYGFTADIQIDRINILSAQIGIVDDGGASHAFATANVSTCPTAWGVFAGMSGCLDIDKMFIESSATGLHGGSEYQLPDTSSFLPTVGTSVTLAVSNSSCDSNSGGLLNVTSRLSLFHIVAKNCYNGVGSMFQGMSNCYTFVDLGGNRCQAAALIDSNPFYGAVFTTSVSNNNAGTPGLYYGIGINAPPQYGITNAAAYAAPPGNLANGSLSTGAVNADVDVLAHEVIEILSATLSSASGFSIAGFCNASYTITNSTQGRSGQRLKLRNFSGQTMTLKHQDAGDEPTAVNRILSPTGADVAISANGWVDIEYSPSQNRWVILGHS